MTPVIAPLWYWLADYYALATCVLFAAVPAFVAVEQPARRLVVGGCTLGGLLALLAFGLIPSWPRTSLGGFRAFSQQARRPPPLIAAPAATSRRDEPGASRAKPLVRRDGDGTPPERSAGLPVQPLPSPPNGGPAPVDRPALFIRAFLAASCMMVARLAIGWRRLTLLRRRSRPAPKRAKELLARVVGETAAPPELLVDDALRQPVAAGVLRPTIILPDRFLEESESRLESALAHEWSHIRNGDLRLTAASRFLLPVLFAHPGYWWLRGRIRDDQETLADIAAAAVEGRLNYAEALLAWSRGAPKRSWIEAGGSIALFERPSQMKRRIAMLLDRDFRVETTCPKWWRTTARVAVASAVATASCLTFRPAVVADAPQGADGLDRSAVLARVVDPDGEPFKGAKVYLSAPWNPPKSGPTTPVPLGATLADGGFRYPSQARLEGEARRQVVATAEGYGPALGDPSASDDETTLKLVRDDVPIQGRVLDAGGRPVAGAKATVVGVLWRPEGLDAWLAALDRGQAAFPAQYEHLRSWASDDVSALIPPVVAGQDGRFTIWGVGRDRVASVLIEGPGVATTFEYVVTRRTTPLKAPDFDRQNYSGDVVYHGAEFDLVAGPELVAVGTVTDRDTGAPLGGAVVGTASLFGNPMRRLRTTTDARGRYRLAGIPPKDHFGQAQRILAEPPDDLPYLAAIKNLGGGDGAAPIVVDLQLKRGVRARGRVVDNATGTGVRAGVGYYALSDNPNLKAYSKYGVINAAPSYQTDGKGNFDLVVMPGPGAIGARAASQRYRLGVGADSVAGLKWKDDDHQIASAYPNHLVPINYHTILGIDPKPGEEEVACEIVLDRGRSVKGRVVDPDGKPLAGARIDGLEDYFRGWSHEPLRSAEFLVEGLGEGASRDLIAYHQGRKLAGAFVIGPDETGPITIRLEPCGVVTGRLLGADGRPLAGVEMTCHAPSRDPKHEVGSLPGAVKTGADGRFRAEGLAPGRKYSFRVWKRLERTSTISDAVKDVVVSRGETKDLGEVRLPEND